MPRFTRLVPDADRRSDDPPFSADNENAKTDVIEGALLGSGPATSVDTYGRNDRRLFPVGRAVVVMFVTYDNMGGGRYYGRALSADQVNWWSGLSRDLTREHFLQAHSKMNNAEIWYPPEIGTSDHNIKADPDEGDVNIGVVMGYNKEGKVIVVVAAGAAKAAARFGAMIEPWTPGNNWVRLQPCVNESDDTPLTDEAGDNLPAVNAAIWYPLNVTRPPPCFGGTTGDVLEYRVVRSYYDPNQQKSVEVLMLVNPPLIPFPTKKYQVLTNVSADPLRANITPDYVRGHPPDSPGG